MRINMFIDMNVGKAIQSVRKSRGYTQPELSDACGWGYSQSRISNYETGVNTLGVDDLQVIAEALRIRLSELFELAETFDPDEADTETMARRRPTKQQLADIAERLANLPAARQRLIVSLASPPPEE